jgi:alkaline phosphatase D
MQGSNSERALLSSSFANGMSGSLETEVPLSHVPLRSPRNAPPGERRHPYHAIRMVAVAAMVAVFIATLVALVAATVMRCRREGGAGCLIPKKAVPLPWGGATLGHPHFTLSRIAFGSCSAYDIRNQSVWDQGVMPAQPDAWVWLGDMYYGDEPVFNCNPANANASACQCEASYIRQPPYMCPAGELDNARDKMVAQVHQPGYRAFLQYSCPGYVGRYRGRYGAAWRRFSHLPSASAGSL